MRELHLSVCMIQRRGKPFKGISSPPPFFLFMAFCDHYTSSLFPYIRGTLQLCRQTKASSDEISQCFQCPFTMDDVSTEGQRSWHNNFESNKLQLCNKHKRLFRTLFKPHNVRQNNAESHLSSDECKQINIYPLIISIMIILFCSVLISHAIHLKL